MPAETELAQNAGRKGSLAGAQIWNDFAFGPEYDGPCPPTTIQPARHRYVVTVYALDRDLTVFFHGQVFPPHFPALPEGLYHSLLEAGRLGHILDSASISGFYSAAAPPGPAHRPGSMTESRPGKAADGGWFPESGLRLRAIAQVAEIQVDRCNRGLEEKRPKNARSHPKREAVSNASLVRPMSPRWFAARCGWGRSDGGAT